MSENVPVRLYEGLFLLNQEAVASDFAGCVDFVRNIFDRAGAELVVLRKWAETRLAYEIKGQRRGVFLLAYFNVSGVQIANIERDCELSELVLRSLIIRADHIGETELNLAAEGAELSLQTVLRSDDEDKPPATSTEDKAAAKPPAVEATDPKAAPSNAPAPAVSNESSPKAPPEAPLKAAPEVPPAEAAPAQAAASEDASAEQDATAAETTT